ncbi:unnamed protein product [Rotaria socialis]
MITKRLLSSTKNIPNKSISPSRNQTKEFCRRYNISCVDKVAWVNEWILKSSTFYASGNLSNDATSDDTSVTNVNATLSIEDIYMNHGQIEDYSDDDEYQVYVRKINQAASNNDRPKNHCQQHINENPNLSTTYEVESTRKKISNFNETRALMVTRECGVCLLIKPEEEFGPAYSERCLHTIRQICNICTYQNIRVILDGAISNQVSCPEPNCVVKLISDEVSRVLAINNDQILLNKYERYLTTRSLDLMDKFYWCAHGCGSGQFDDSQKTRDLKIHCGVCEKDTCAFHRVKWHDKMTCDRYDKLHPSIDSMTNKWMKNNSKLCPGCQCKIEKNGGCFHMTCKRCHYQFCWECMANYTTRIAKPQRQHKISCQHHPIGNFLILIHLMKRREL